MIRHAKAAVQYASDRLREPSTQAGIAGVSVLIGHGMTNDLAVATCNTVGAVFGLLAIVTPDDSGGTPCSP